MTKPGIYQHFKNKFYTIYGVGKIGVKPASDSFLGQAHYSENPDVKVGIYVGDNGLVLTTASEELDENIEYVVYQALYESAQFGTRPIWIRPRDDFEGYKVMDEQNKVKRFTHLL
jgi:hypothetical protein